MFVLYTKPLKNTMVAIKYCMQLLNVARSSKRPPSTTKVVGSSPVSNI